MDQAFMPHRGAGPRSAHAPYAVLAVAPQGRVYPELPSPTRTDFQRDRDRIVHCTGFRRLAHKTQVFVYHEGDHFRTRLTHTIEVAQIARALSRTLGVDEDLAEALALSHDLGHTPFGHTGEDALHACMSAYGGFDHNAQALRLVTRLERRYARHDGLNLCWDTLEGLVKHNGPLLTRDGRPRDRYAASGVPEPILEFDRQFPLGLDTYASLEAQAAAIADDIAYNAHDLDDGLRAGLFGLEELAGVPFLADLLDEIAALHPGLDDARRIHELSRRVITRLVEDAGAEAERRLAALRPRSVADVRGAGQVLVTFSPAMAEADRAIKSFLMRRMYRHPRVMAVRQGAEVIVRDLFARLFAEPALLPAEWQAGMDGLDEARRARRVADYLAGMTDRYALQRHRQLFDATPELR